MTRNTKEYCVIITESMIVKLTRNTVINLICAHIFYKLKQTILLSFCVSSLMVEPPSHRSYRHGYEDLPMNFLVSICKLASDGYREHYRRITMRKVIGDVRVCPVPLLDLPRTCRPLDPLDIVSNPSWASPEPVDLWIPLT